MLLGFTKTLLLLYNNLTNATNGIRGFIHRGISRKQESKKARKQESKKARKQFF